MRALFFLALYQMYEYETTTLTWYALALAAVYLGIGALFEARFPGRGHEDSSICCTWRLLIAFITIAIPLKLDAQWITIGWLIESAVLLWISVKTQIGLSALSGGGGAGAGDRPAALVSTVFTPKPWC